MRNKIPEHQERLSAWMSAGSARILKEHGAITVGDLAKVWPNLKKVWGNSSEQVNVDCIRLMKAFYANRIIQVYNADELIGSVEEESRPKESRPKENSDLEEPEENLVGEFLPTGFPPGSLEKQEVMKKRFEEGKPLHHPHDATW